ncbi:MAG: hypothetical protein ACXVUL_14340 [Solirubrobacteraceae bacterium]
MVAAAAQHAAASHGHEDTPELHEQLRAMLEPEALTRRASARRCRSPADLARRVVTGARRPRQRRLGLVHPEFTTALLPARRGAVAAGGDDALAVASRRQQHSRAVSRRRARLPRPMHRPGVTRPLGRFAR